MADDDLHAEAPLDRLPVPRKRHGGLIVTVAILVIFGVVIWYVYQRVTQTSEPMAPPLIKAEQGPVKVSPDSPGGMQVPNQDKAIYDRIGNGGDKGGSVEKLLPPPETPKPEAPPQAKPTDGPRAVAVAPLAPSGDASKAAATAIATPPAPAPSALDKPPPPPSGAAPISSPTSPSAPVAPAKTAAVTPPATKPAATSPAAKAAVTAPAAPGSARVQLGAFRQVADAEQTWQKLTKKFPDLLGGLSPSIVRVDLGEKGIYQRLQAGPLTDRAAAAAMCEQLKARKQDCLVVAH